MSKQIRENQSSASLIIQIAETERMILDQRVRVRVHARQLDQQVRARLTSKTMLFLAAGVGFLTDKLTKRPNDFRGGVPGGNSPTPPANTFLDTALKVVALVSGVLHAMPAAGTQQPPRTDPAGDSANPQSCNGGTSEWPGKRDAGRPAH
ncbi:MAG: hypothetical protein ABI724_09335 [Betaproteobacteria bacterium]